MGAELIEMPDAVEACRSEIAAGFVSRFPGVSVVGRKPSTLSLTTRFLLVRLVGGTEDTFYDSATLAIEGWGKDLEDSYALCRFGCALLHQAERNGFVGGVPCRRVVAFARPGELPDVTGHARVTATLAVTLRGSGTA